jgi:hypothetical protein
MGSLRGSIKPLSSAHVLCCWNPIYPSTYGDMHSSMRITLKPTRIQGPYQIKHPMRWSIKRSRTYVICICGGKRYTLKLSKETSFRHEPTRLEGLDSQDKAMAIVYIGLMHTRSRWREMLYFTRSPDDLPFHHFHLRLQDAARQNSY